MRKKGRNRAASLECGFHRETQHFTGRTIRGENLAVEHSPTVDLDRRFRAGKKSRGLAARRATHMLAAAEMLWSRGRLIRYEDGLGV
jgi:hypothetical protein